MSQQQQQQQQEHGLRADASAKLEKARVWLASVFHPAPVPQFEVTEDTVAAIWKLAAAAQERDANAVALAADLALKSQEYQAEATRVQELLALHGLDKSRLSDQTHANVRSLARLASLLHVNDTSLASLYCALSDLSASTFDEWDGELQRQRRAQTMHEQVTSSLSRLSELRRTLAELDQAETANVEIVERRQQERTFYNNKAAEYQASIAKLQQQHPLASEPSIRHAAIMAESEAVKQIIDELTAIRTTLDTFQKLPPDFTMAKLKIEEARRELSRLEQAVTQGFSAINA
ncbi:hypothetical protein CAOG_06273 [Capsaspora owczarzaki ATCC 30864]|uniref:HAUS augmin-like complex subunit 1 n=1 Tax=Capsaspora owczarzaki (strain ATCC 30864) TaxID=595528 RepID=A0A0D2WTL9_CAPO3|nr:hypothetical protein CAOG_06273 [Capsaspora owczarzaki ATCC 30864]KJE95870.1 hypothetical protein CAOG_006273 [Capsaspora owczarzaki ATCC 30864]|eukprot:XP_004345022.1 hypothetical protein CAOG_06273 [Capsaspora owczarzaki ATCC 30864]